MYHSECRLPNAVHLGHLGCYLCCDKKALSSVAVTRQLTRIFVLYCVKSNASFLKTQLIKLFCLYLKGVEKIYILAQLLKVQRAIVV